MDGALLRICATPLKANGVDIQTVGRGRDVARVVPYVDDAHALARLFAASPKLFLAVKSLLATQPVFRLKPIGAPHSAARLEQDAQITAEDELRAVVAEIEGEG